MSSQLERIQARADERRDNEGLYDFQRDARDTFVTVLCYLLGAGEISDEALDRALVWLAEADVSTAARRAEAVS